MTCRVLLPLSRPEEKGPRMLEGAEITLLGVGLAAVAVWAGWLAVRAGRRDSGS